MEKKKQRPTKTADRKRERSEREQISITKGGANASSPNGKRLKLLGDRTVSIIAGAEKRVFVIHKGLLCSISDYFRAAIDGSIEEAEEQKIELLQDDPEVVGRFQLWLYSEKVLDKGEKSTALEYSMLVNLYVFAESRCIPRLQNDLIDAILRKSRQEHRSPTPSDGDMYSNTASSSPLRKLVIDMAARLGELNRPSWELDKYPKDYMVSLVLALHELKELRVEDPDSGLTLWKYRCSKYHIHAANEPECLVGEYDGDA
ncbi:hypothetical protein MMC30_000681 [Trapelia coarctata]|nr:hypothetical protein [Trapelia coarctata]